MNSRAGRQVRALVDTGHFRTSGNIKTSENITIEQVKLAAQNYTKFYTPHYPYSLEFKEDYANDKSMQITVAYTGPAYQSASGLRQNWLWTEYVPFYWHVLEAQQEANELAVKEVGPIQVQPSPSCLWCCGAGRQAEAEAKAQEIEHSYNSVYWPVYSKHIDAIGPEWTALHVAWLIQRFDKQIEEFIANPGSQCVAQDTVSLHLGVDALADLRPRSPSRFTVVEMTSRDSDKLLSG